MYPIYITSGLLMESLVLEELRQGQWPDTCGSARADTSEKSSKLNKIRENTPASSSSSTLFLVSLQALLPLSSSAISKNRRTLLSSQLSQPLQQYSHFSHSMISSNHLSHFKKSTTGLGSGKNLNPHSSFTPKWPLSWSCSCSTVWY